MIKNIKVNRCRIIIIKINRGTASKTSDATGDGSITSGYNTIANINHPYYSDITKTIAANLPLATNIVTRIIETDRQLYFSGLTLQLKL
ncbi:hypothetical protein [Aurantibacter sp.]|uniref:hypothetical protein n=1 Tax=Aurantibacter sp. TaxID=2807103 RepID=UPI0035C7A36D